MNQSGFEEHAAAKRGKTWKHFGKHAAGAKRGKKCNRLHHS